MKNEKVQPAKWAIRFLEWFCPPELLEGILGDLLEAFEQDRRALGKGRAQRKFILHVFRLFHPSILFRNHLNSSVMKLGIIRNHLLIAWRQMRKNGAFALINITGLSLAIAFIFLTYLFIQKERSYDQFHENKDTIFRLYHTAFNRETGQISNQSAVTAVPLGEMVAAEVPVIQNYCRVASSSGVVRKQENLGREVISFVDPVFLQLFSFPWLAGDQRTALASPNSIVLSAALAKKYFGDEDALQQEMEVSLNDSLLKVVVTGVMEPRKESSSIQVDCLLPFEHYGAIIPPKMFTSLNFGVVENYIQVREEAELSLLPALLSKAIEKATPEDKDRLEIGIQSLSAIHLEHEILGNTPYTNPQKLYILLGIALLVLVVALINFITLSSSQALTRLQEMGLRRTLGAGLGQIRGQLMVESLVITGLAALVGLVLAFLLCPSFAQLVDVELNFRFGAIEVLGLLLLISLLSFISGVGQGMLLVRHNTTQALKGQLGNISRRQWVNEALIVFQFSLSILLILGSVHIHQQLRFIQQKDLGFEQERLLELPLGDSPDRESMRRQVERFKEELLRNQQILSIAGSMNNTADPWTELFFAQEDGDEEGLYFNLVDRDYLSTMGIELKEGRTFSPQMKKGILVNEALVEHFGWDAPLAQQLPGAKFQEPHEIIGVIKDFHFSSLHNKVAPLILATDPSAISSGITGLSTYVWPPNLYRLMVRIGPGDLEPVLQFIETKWQQLTPNAPFEFNFVDETLAAKYAEEQRWGTVINLSSWFGIGIAWLGLFALMHLMIKRRLKEIGIRKVLGASTSGLIRLLSQNYSRLLLLSAVIACPIAWHLLRSWLNAFSYRIELNPLLIIGIALAVIIITLLLFSLHTLQATRLNPVEAIQRE